MKIYPVIMCGGAGTRLWPASTRRQPKQFHRLVSDKSLFQETILRLQNVPGVDVAVELLVISNQAYREIAEAQLAEIGVEPLALLLEPEGRNTAAVAAMASEYIARFDPSGLVLMLPSDHHIAELTEFHTALADAAPVAASGRITTFGISPIRPDTGFGYIQKGKPIAANVFEVEAFREKPDLETAECYLADGGFTWNAGIFLFPPQLMLKELATFAPDVLTSAIRALDASYVDGLAHYLDPTLFATIRSDSVDYAVMERTRHAAVCGPVSCGWSDIGTWPVVGELSTRKLGNQPILIDSENCIIHSDDETLVAAVGVTDLVIVAVEKSVLVVHKSQAQNVGKVVAELKRRGLKDRF